MMAPLEEHYDDGFGAVAEAFLAAAKALAKENDGKRLFWNHLPEIFLVRHAIELFLKSGIIILHRKLKLPYDSPDTQTPSQVRAPFCVQFLEPTRHEGEG